MTMLSPAATYHAELLAQLGTVGRALSVQRGLLWLARGLAAGTILVLGLVVWAWARDAVATLPILLLVGVPLGLSVLTAAGSLFIRHNTRELARRVSTGGQNQSQTGASGSQLDAITRPEQVSSNGAFAPDQSSANPYLGDAGSSTAQTAPEAVQPSFSNKPTQGNDSGSIPLGLRDLVKDYFSALDQK